MWWPPPPSGPANIARYGKCAPRHMAERGRTLVHSPHCRAAGSGPAPLSYPSVCLGAIHFAVIEFLWRVIFIQQSITAPLDLDSVST